MSNSKDRINQKNLTEVLSVILQERHEDGSYNGSCFQVSPKPIRVYLLSDAHDLFKKQWLHLDEVIPLPSKVHLLDVKINGDNVYCHGFVLSPDYLMDITAIANCFDAFGYNEAGYFIQKFSPFQINMSLMTGNIVNYFLDQLLHDSSLQFEDLLPSIFQQYGLQISLYTDREVQDLVGSLRSHYNNLQQVISVDFGSLGIEMNQITLEPSFYSPDYGLQGRMDVLITKGNSKGIIELKSGKIYRPNESGLNMSHYVQTILYHVLSRNTEVYSDDMSSYILYSQLNQSAMKYAPPNRQVELLAMAVRNQLVLGELSLDKLPTSVSYLDYLGIKKESLYGFSQTNFALLEKHYEKLDNLEKAYINRMIRFLSQEYHLSKVGTIVRHEFRGQSTLWLSSREEKIRQYALLDNLLIRTNTIEENRHFITLETTPDSPQSSNFREGDVIVIYPTEESKTADYFQIFKGSIVGFEERGILIQLRNVQKNNDYFDKFTRWSLEPDFMDSSFSWAFRSFDEWSAISKEKRSKILGVVPPQSPVTDGLDLNLVGLTPEQNDTIAKAVSSEDHFLIWGPPGTGKTSFILKNLVAQELHHASPILVLAYTNRAVDEICDSLDLLNAKMVRIGSEYSVSSDHQKHLLQNQISKFTNRREVIDFLQSQEIVIGTLSSLMGKPELFELISFHTAIIDEASQILEPQILAILSRVSKYILIGDHTQLPAVVVQSEEDSLVNSVELQKDLGLYTCRNSYFERMYLRSKDQANENIAVLSSQGRMHPKIMDFVSREFYENRLQMMPGWTSTLDESKTYSDRSKIFIEQRMMFFSTDSSLVDYGIENEYSKRDELEAELIVDLVGQVNDSFIQKLRSDSIGIIAPFRAQVSQIKSLLSERFPDLARWIDVDTVERFQGSSRDFIFYSTCVHSPEQLDQIVSLSEQGIDRKLNVVLSRAREMVFMVGNEKILKNSQAYSDFIDNYKVNSDS